MDTATACAPRVGRYSTALAVASLFAAVGASGGTSSCGAKTGLEVPCTIPVEPSTPQIVLVVDHGFGAGQPISIVNIPNGTCPEEEFDPVVGMLNQTLPSLDATTATGLYVYPEVGVDALMRDGYCTTPTQLLVPIAPHNSGAALALLHQWNSGIPNTCAPFETQGAGEWPVDAALQVVGAALAGTPRHAPHFIVLVANSTPNCGVHTIADCRCATLMPPGDASCVHSPADLVLCLDSDATVTTIQELHDRQQVQTLVIGDDYTMPTAWYDAAFRTSAAAAGGFPRAGSARNWYGVRELAAIQQAVQGTIVPAGLCLPRAVRVTPDLADYQLESSRRGVLPRDPSHTNGWDWSDLSDGTLQIYGAACTQTMQDAAALTLVQPRRLCPE